MRILAVTPLYPPESRVGAWLATHEFLAQAVRRGHAAVVATQFAQPAGEHDGVTILSRIRRPERLAELARAADIVITHVPAGADAARTAGVPCVQMGHGSEMARFDGADLVVANSRSLAERTDGRVEVCHPFTVPAMHAVARTGDALTIVNCSTAKGIKTAWRLAEMLPDRRFLGVKGGYGEQITPRAPNFTTWPNQPDMRAVWAETRILLMPSEFETWGMVAVEAALNGIPVIAHPTPGLLESLGAAGIFADRDRPDDWLAAIERLDDPAEYARASAAVRRRATEIPDHRDKFVDLLEGLTP